MNDIPDSIDVALRMIPCRGWTEDRPDYPMTDEKLIGLVANRALHNDFVGKNVPVMFRSTNYETYIYPCKSSRCYVVNTCNNDPWDIPTSNKDPLEFRGDRYKDGINGITYYNNDTWYWDPQTDLWIKPTNNWKLEGKCKHYDSYYIKGAPEGDLCPICLANNAPQYTIGEQINKQRRKEMSKLPKFFNLRVDL